MIGTADQDVKEEQARPKAIRSDLIDVLYLNDA
jgi:hypothetical protein